MWVAKGRGILKYLKDILERGQDEEKREKEKMIDYFYLNLMEELENELLGAQNSREWLKLGKIIIYVWHYWFLGEKLPDKGLLEQAMDRMVSRGPDDQGVCYSPKAGLALGHRRLSTWSFHGRSAMISNDGRFTVIFNGEIYNFQEIVESWAVVTSLKPRQTRGSVSSTTNGDRMFEIFTRYVCFCDLGRRKKLICG